MRQNFLMVLLIVVILVLLVYSGLWRQLFAAPDTTSRCLAQAQGERVRDALSKSRGNGLWYTPDRSETVLVFVHGILSDNITAWCYTEGQKPHLDKFWPQLIREDNRFAGTSIFLAGYPAGPAIGDYGIDWIAETLFSELRTPGPDGADPVLDNNNLVFIGHSAGGIAIRKMLLEHQAAFRDKNLGVVLMASPSLGSQDADLMDDLIEFWNFELGRQLKWRSEYLLKIDERFGALLANGVFRRLVGGEAIENNAPWVGPFRRQLVEPESGAHYFEHQKMIPGSDHMSIVKPSGQSDHSHMFLAEFYLENYLEESARP